MMNNTPTPQNLESLKKFACVTLGGMSIVLAYSTYKDLERSGMLKTLQHSLPRNMVPPRGP